MMKMEIILILFAALFAFWGLILALVAIYEEDFVRFLACSILALWGALFLGYFEQNIPKPQCITKYWVEYCLFPNLNENVKK